MIGKIKGQLISKTPPLILIECNSGLSYEVMVSMNTLYALGETGTEVNLFTHFVVREDTQQLYAFHNQEEQRLFRTLIKVNGVGPKLAISILSSISVNEFVLCVNDNDSARLVKLPGIGKKTAERLIIEMQDKLKDFETGSKPADENNSHPNIVPRRSTVQDAISALVTLGYKPQQASRAIAFLEAENKTTEELIKEALRIINEQEKAV